MQLSRMSARQIRTRALERRKPQLTDQRRGGVLFDRPSSLSANETTATSPEPVDRQSDSSSTTTEAPVAPTLPKRIQQGFPTARSHNSSEGDKNSSLKTEKATEAATTPNPEIKKERFPRKLQAFPFVPGATSSELAKAHKFFFLPADFVKSATSLAMIPENTMIPEVAFIGRSNIGKSSLINGLVNRNGLVKTSSKPGHTRMMNFFKIGDKLSLVDMPGYGWKSRDEWGGMILSYLQNRKNLKRIYILIDPSHGLKESDTQIMKLLDGSGLSYQVVLTKVDKLSKTKYIAAKAHIESQLVKDAICCFPMVLGVSSKNKDGLDDLRAAILKAGQLF
ncbi:hypothetical protein BGZ67_003879 [Mortierella alpina]|nr:hypothetical protein BGZ67_003879 [Mortierella alpina]